MMPEYVQILQECARVAEERGEQYGSVEENIAEIQRIADAMFGLKISIEDIVRVMIATKVAREKNKQKEDNRIDLINYTAILNYFIEKKSRN